MDTHSKLIAAQSGPVAKFSGFAGLSLCLFATFSLLQFGYGQTSVPNSSPEAKPQLNYETLAGIVQRGDTISDCRLAGSDLADLLIRIQVGNDSARLLSSGIRVQNSDIEGPVTVIGGSVSLPVTFTNCNFNGPVTLDDTHFRHNLEILKSHFAGDVTGRGMHVSGDFIITDSSFASHNEVLFSNAQIDGDLTWMNTQFLSEKGVDGARLSVSQDARFSNVEFAGLADFGHCRVDHLLKIEGCKFKGSDQAASFSGVVTKEDVQVIHSGFYGITLWDHLNARGLYFSDRTSFSQEVEFPNLTIDRSMSFDAVETVSGITVRDSKISEDLYIKDLKITAKSDKDNHSAPPGFCLIDTNIRNLKLARISILGKLDLEGDTIGILDLTDVPQDPGYQCKLVNLSVRSFTPLNESLRGFINKAEFDPGLYVSLENFLTSRGQTDLAKSIFMDRNWRVEDVRPKDLSWLWQCIIGIIAGWGRAPEYSLIPCLGVVLIGCYFFRDKTKMQVNEDKFQDRHYNAFWYSLDVFAPIIDLEAAKVWSPKPDQTVKWFVFRAERILGWLLVPIAIAAFTGFLHS